MRVQAGAAPKFDVWEEQELEAIFYVYIYISLYKYIYISRTRPVGHGLLQRQPQNIPIHKSKMF